MAERRTYRCSNCGSNNHAHQCADREPPPCLPDPIAAVAAKLSIATKKLILAGSARKPKRWGPLYRHAKVSWNARVGNLHPFFTHEGRSYPWPVTLTPLGLAVRAHLKGQTDDQG